jgi:hypothetical protein
MPLDIELRLAERLAEPKLAPDGLDSKFDGSGEPLWSIPTHLRVPFTLVCG